MDALVTVENNNIIHLPIANYSPTQTFLPKDFTLQSTDIYLGSTLQKAPPPSLASMGAKEGKPPPITNQKKLYLLAFLNLEGVPQHLHQQYIDFVLENHDVFSSSKYELGNCGTVQHRIRTRGEEPIFVPQFKIPHNDQPILLAHVRELLKMKAIRRCHSPYNSPVFLVEKPGGAGKRVVQDLRSLNRATLEDRYSIRDARECIDALGQSGSQVFSTLDLSGAFWQQQLHKDSQLKTAFTIPFLNTQFCWTRSVMGSRGAPASFSRLMGVVFQDLDGVITYVDDALCHSKSHSSHLVLLREVARRLRTHGLKLNIRKCFFGRRSTHYLGHHISPEGVSIAKDKVKALREYPTPTTVKKVEEFLGLANYFRAMIPSFARRSFPLCRLTRKSSTWKDGQPLPPKAKRAFHDIIDILCKEPVMAYPDPNKPYLLATDAALGDDENPGGMGAILSQPHGDTHRVVAYWSRQLKEHEKNYSAFAIEQKSILDAMDHFNEYLRGAKTRVLCDHRPIEHASKVHEKTLKRLHELLLEYDMEILYRPGKDNGGPDTLSRNAISVVSRDPTDKSKIVTRTVTNPQAAAPVPQEQLDFQDKVSQQQGKDPFVCAIKNFLESKTLPSDPDLAKIVPTFAPKCYLSAGQLWFVDKRRGQLPKSRLVAPQSLVFEIIALAHSTPISGHGGIDRTMNRILNDYWWPTMAHDVAHFLARCPECQATSDPKGDKNKIPLHPWEQALRPNDRVHCDLVGPMRSEGPNSYIIVLTDAFSKWVEVGAIPNKEASTVARAIFDLWVTSWTCPSLLVVDGGREFANRVLGALLGHLGTHRHIVSPRHPRSAGQVERFNREMKAFLQAFVSDHTLDWEGLLSSVKLAHNTAVHRSTKFTPFFLRTLQDPTFPWSCTQTTPSHPTVADLLDKARWAREQVTANNADARNAYKAYYDKRTTEKTFKVGDRVLGFFDNPAPGVNHKLWRPWKGIYHVEQVKDLGTLLLRHSVTGKQLLRHQDLVKLFHEFDDPANADVDVGPASTALQPSSQDQVQERPHQQIPPPVASQQHVTQHIPQQSLSSPTFQRPAQVRRPSYDKDCLYKALHRGLRLSLPAGEAHHQAPVLPPAPGEQQLPNPQLQQQQVQVHQRNFPDRGNLLDQVAQQVFPRRTTRNQGVPAGTWTKDDKFVPANH